MLSITSRPAPFFVSFTFLALKLLLLLNLVFPKIIYSSELYSIQAGAFSTKENAQDLLNSLEKNGIACSLHESAGLYKVYCGKFTQESEADATIKKLTFLGYTDIFIVSNISPLLESSQETVIKPADTMVVKITENETIKPEIPLERKETTVIPRIIADSTEVTNRRHSTDNLFASDEPFTGPGNRGLTGLMEIPTARVMREESYRVGVTLVHPYWYYYFGVAPFKGLEIFGRFTKVEGVTAGLGEGYGDFKDRALELKYQFIPEGKYNPAIAIGFMDPHGTRRYASQYIVASKQIYPFDFTIGMGNGRFGKKPLPIKEEAGFRMEILQDPKEWWRSKNFFWGVEFAPSEKFSLIAEYNPIKYHKQTQDPAQKKYFKNTVPSQYNFGIRLMPWKWTELDLS
ncbi:MAG TPA: YjbH domain-containing protein, partial [Thermodesulfovibrionales bacterium]|nr:YjbH domain-containing protein [Thermodesulfovibrionales bacterium]